VSTPVLVQARALACIIDGVMAERGKNPKRNRSRKDECVIPPRMAPDVQRRFVVKRSEREEHAIREYVEWQARGEKVTHAEKVATERLRDRKLDAWDVWTDKDRYWVITNPTNLYSQTHFPSLDYTISFHVGVMARVAARHEPPATDEQQRRLAAAWRRWTQAAEALDEADEAEEFQAVGMRCRECLLEFVRAVADSRLVPRGVPVPKRGDVPQWTEVIAQAIASGASAERFRAYLKATAKATWDLVNWLTHEANATRLDAAVALEATANVLGAFGAALVRYERGAVDRCPECGSYRLSADYRPDLDIEPPYLAACESCGWVEPRGQQPDSSDV
jgi:hypothetical protein